MRERERREREDGDEGRGLKCRRVGVARGAAILTCPADCPRSRKGSVNEACMVARPRVNSHV